MYTVLVLLSDDDGNTVNMSKSFATIEMATQVYNEVKAGAVTDISPLGMHYDEIYLFDGEILSLDCNGSGTVHVS